MRTAPPVFREEGARHVTLAAQTQAVERAIQVMHTQEEVFGFSVCYDGQVTRSCPSHLRDHGAAMSIKAQNAAAVASTIRR